jgi:predicted DsbA family dithiol-disulfide isomerase
VAGKRDIAAIDLHGARQLIDEILASETWRSLIQTSIDQARKLGIRVTPVFFVGTPLALARRGTRTA